MNLYSIVYLSFWLFLELGALLWPYAYGRMELAPLVSIYFLISVPFLLFAMRLPRLRTKDLAGAYMFYLPVASALYLGLGHVSSKEHALVYLYEGNAPLLWQLVLLFVCFVLLSVGQDLRKSYDRLELRKGARDREELETFYEMKAALLPEEGLTPFRYKELLKIGVSFVASQRNRVRAAIQLLPFEDVFFLYDLTHVDLNGAHALDDIDFLLERLFSRPEIRWNRPSSLVYVARKGDRIWEEKLKRAGFVALEESDPRLLLFQKRLAGILSIHFEDWEPFAKVERWYEYTAPSSAKIIPAKATPTNDKLI